MLATLTARPIPAIPPVVAERVGDAPNPTIRQLAAYLRMLANEYPEQARLLDTTAQALIAADTDRREILFALSFGNVDNALAIAKRPTTVELPAPQC